jgi:hypothetical protein
LIFTEKLVIWKCKGSFWLEDVILDVPDTKSKIYADNSSYKEGEWLELVTLNKNTAIYCFGNYLSKYLSRELTYIEHHALPLPSSSYPLSYIVLTLSTSFWE